MVKNEEEVKLPSKEEIMRIAEERTRRDVAETRMKGAAKELGFSADVDPAVLEREVKKSLHFEVGERVYANGEGASVFEKVPELADKFKSIGTSDHDASCGTTTHETARRLADASNASTTFIGMDSGTEQSRTTPPCSHTVLANASTSLSSNAPRPR